MAMADIDLDNAKVVTAPDGAGVHLLGDVAGAGTAVFELGPGAIARAVRHPRVEEVWFVLSGSGRIWRSISVDDLGSVAELVPNRSLVLPRGTTFQWRCEGGEPLRILGTTSPRWEGPQDAEAAEGPWIPTI